MKRYEAMFLFDNAVLHQWSDMEAEARRLFDRIDATLHVCLKFDERKLAYEIRGRKRGTYVLTYFDADPGRIADLERDVQLSEVVLRMLVLRADSVGDERLAELKALPADQPLQPSSGDGRRPDGGGPRGRMAHHRDRESEDSKPARKAGVGAWAPATGDADTGKVEATSEAHSAKERPAQRTSGLEPPAGETEDH